MTTTQDKLGAYSTHQRKDENSRETDARALLSCASRLKNVLDAGGSDFVEYGEAIRHNQRLWTIFQVALCDPDNPLPRDLKITLLNLSRYIDRVSLRAMAEFAPQILNSLIDINRRIAAGLSVKQPQQAQQPPAAPGPSTPPPGVTSVMTTA
ncbi:MAG: flagellar biosynthesis regulator FlaF [Alphaproteobacteria bacterium]|nr:flagellar biosynthesis regulator FlaF [Alphaproteobacteria bacterium]